MGARGEAFNDVVLLVLKTVIIELVLSEGITPLAFCMVA